MKSPTPKQLQEFVNKNNLSATDLGNIVRASKSGACRWLNGDRNCPPGVFELAKIKVEILPQILELFGELEEFGIDVDANLKKKIEKILKKAPNMVDNVNVPCDNHIITKGGESREGV